MIFIDELTKQLQNLITGRFIPNDAMELVRKGADPNQFNFAHDTLLHLLIQLNNDGVYDAYIKELVETHRAKIDIENWASLTPFQWLLYFPYFSHDIDSAMKLVRLGADPEQLNSEGDSFLQILINENLYGQYDAYIEELNTLITYKKNRTNFINLLFILLPDIANPSSQSTLKQLPFDILIHIISFFGSSIDKTAEECVALARTVFKEPDKIKEMAKTPGGINVFQTTDTKGKAHFTLFKSAKILCLDYEKLKSTLKETQTECPTTSEKKLPELRQNYAT